MIDPILSLAFSIQSNPGVYALLLGSGVSRAAGIPTGWEITLDLVRKLAQACEEECEPDPESWFLAKFGQAPDYSQLLDQLAGTPAERQQLLRPYFEANEQEREEGKKQTTAAHHAIAQMAAQGFVRVVITTNFDRLLESAMNETGVVPTVISSADQAKGTLPLIHTKCCVFKVHGDYLDTRILNSPNELAKYQDEINKLLDRILDEFGLIVCGWSGDWDEALRRAICRAPSRRFTTFWAVRGTPSDHAQRLINHRQAQVITIEDADSFFQAVQQHVESIDEFSKPHPLSTEAAVASLKRYLSEPKYKIQLEDLIKNTVQQVVRDTSGPNFTTKRLDLTTETVTARIRAYEAPCSTLMAMAAVAGHWAEEEHVGLWQRELEILSKVQIDGDYDDWLFMRRYPATLLFYSLGIGAVDGDRLSFLSQMFSTTVYHWNNEKTSAVQMLAADLLFGDRQKMKLLEGMDRFFLPFNEWMRETLQQYTNGVFPDQDRYTYSFDKLELLMSLNSFRQPTPSFHSGRSLGAFHNHPEDFQRLLEEIKESIVYSEDQSPYVEANIFGATAAECNECLMQWGDWLSGWTNLPEGIF